MKHLPEVPHNWAALSVDHDDAVQVPHAAAGQRCNAALGSGHGLWRHCTVETYVIMMMLQRDPGAAETVGVDQLSGFKGEASHTSSLMSGRILSQA